MSPLGVFVRTLLKSSAICLGIAIAILQPSFSAGTPGAENPAAKKQAISTLVTWSARQPSSAMMTAADMALLTNTSDQKVPSSRVPRIR